MLSGSVFTHDISAKVFSWLYASEVCEVSQVSKHFRDDAKRWFKTPREVCHRPRVDSKASRWLRHLLAHGVRIKSIVLCCGRPFRVSVVVNGEACANWDEDTYYYDEACEYGEFNAVLYCARRDGFADVVQLLLSVPRADPSHAATNGGRFALAVAAQFDRADVVERLLGDYSLDLKRRWPLKIAAQRGHLESFRLIWNDPKLEIDNWFCDSVLHAAVRGGHLSIVQEMCNGRFDWDWCDTPLITAVKRGYADIVKFLCEDPRTDVNVKDERGLTPLLRATIGGHINIVKILLEYKAVNAFYCTDEFIDDGCHAEITSALHYATSKPELLRLLLSADYIDVNECDSRGRTPLHLAASCGHLESVAMLCGHPDIDVNLCEEYGRTPLHHAVSSGHRKVVEYLCGLGLKNVRVVDHDTPRHHTKEEVGGVKRSLHDPKENNDVVARSPLPSNDQVDVNTACSQSPGRSCSLVDINAQDRDGESALHYVAKLDDAGAAVAIARILCAHPHADLNLLDDDGKAPIHVAMEKDASAGESRRLGESRRRSRWRNPRHLGESSHLSESRHLGESRLRSNRKNRKRLKALLQMEARQRHEEDRLTRDLEWGERMDLLRSDKRMRKRNGRRK